MLRFFTLIAFTATSVLFAQDTTGTGTLTGKVHLSEDQPLAGAKVCTTQNQRCAITAQDGVFRITDLRPGIYDLEITAAGRPATKQSGIEVRAGLDVQLRILLPAIDALKQEITVTENFFVAQEEVKTSGYVIQGREVYQSAGALQDVSRYVQTLPGVTFGADDFRNDIIVRGGSPLENLYVVDNIEIPNINNFASFASSGGVVSMLDAALIQDVNFLAGGYPAPYINRLSSVLQVTQREGARDKLHRRATVGFAGAGGIVEGPINKGKGSWVVSARRSFLDLFTDDVGFGGVPVNYSFNTKVLYDLSPNDRIWVANITGIDEVRIRPDPTNEDQQTNQYNINYDGWRTATGFNWQRLFGSRGVGLLGVTHSEANVRSRLEDTLQNGLPIFDDDNTEGETTFKYDLTYYVPVLDRLQAGGSFKLFRLRYRTDQPFGFDNPLDPVPGANPFVLRQNYRATQSGGYFQSTRNLTRRLSLTWGGRLDHYEYISQTRFSPRAGLSYRITDRISAHASYGQYYQQPFFFFLSSFDVNRGLIPARSEHIVVGGTWIVSPTLRVTLEGYEKEYKDYAVSQEYRTYTLANAGDTFAINNYLFPLVSGGRGKARGVELYVEKRFTDKWYGQFNVAYARSRHAALDGVFRRGSFDSPVIANAVGGYRFNRKWEASARVVFVDGRPYTPHNQALSFAQNRLVLDTTQTNALRAPDYFRVDFRVDRTFTIRDKPLLIFFGLQNATNRKNFQSIDWNPYDRRIQTRNQLGLFPLIGLDWRF